MIALKFIEYNTGSLYFSAVASQLSLIDIEDINGKPVKTRLSEAISMCIFPDGFESNLNNQKKFLAACHSEGILPGVQIYDLSAKNRKSSAHHIVLITGSFDEYINYLKMFYLPQADSIFEKLFHSKDWSLINPKLSHSNVAQKGYWISNLDPFEDQLKEIRDGDYVIDQSIFKPATDLRLSANGKNPDVTIDAEEQADQQTALEFTETPNETEDEITEKEIPTDTILEIPGYPLGFSLNSLEIKQAHKYLSGTTESELKAAPNYRLLVAGITVQNKTECFMRFSSVQFSVLKKSGEKVDALLYGVGTSVVESGRILSVESKVTGPDEKPVVSFKGKLSENVAFFEWVLSPGKSYEDNLIYLIPATESNPDLKFTQNNGPLRHTGESPIKIAFNSKKIQQSYQYTSGSSQIETTASSEYRFLVAKVTMTNNAEVSVRYSSENFSILDNSGGKISATFFGAENNIAENGKITSFETNIDNPDKKQEAKITGILNPSVSFIEWELGPNYSRQETLVYLIPSNADNVKLHFDYCLGDGKHYTVTSSSDKGCFIATAAFSEMSPEVAILRTFRDEILAKNYYGRKFISAYYFISPAIARLIRESLYLREKTRVILRPVVKLAENALDNTLPFHE